MTKPISKELAEEFEKDLRNPQVDFSGEQNLAVQTGNKSIAQQIEDFARAGRSILVARDNLQPIPGLPAYPDPIEAILLEREVRADILIARKKISEDQAAAQEQARIAAEKNAEELSRIKALQNNQEPAIKPQ